MDLTQFHVPNVKKNNQNLYPTEFITKPKKLYLDQKETKTQQEFFENMKIQDYCSDFKGNARFYDLHGHSFQNWALQYTNTLSTEEIQKLTTSNHADLRIVRARVYAISTRNDVDWDGQSITDEEKKMKKQKEMDHYYETLTLYDWTKKNINFTPLDEKLETKISIENIDTQESVNKLKNQYPKLKICWLNLAAGHNVCGAYSVNFGGSQEEHVATCGNSTALLGCCGTIVEEGVKNYIRGNYPVYDEGYHIPPGGNYYSETKFITSEQVECSTIACAFADFRTYIPFFVPYSEASDYYGLFGVKNQNLLEERLMMDMHGVLKTAIYEKVDVLILGASGCGAFLHDAQLEAKMWKKVLQMYKGYFVEVNFAILDSKDGKNITAFTKEFKDELKNGQLNF